MLMEGRNLASDLDWEQIGLSLGWMRSPSPNNVKWNKPACPDNRCKRMSQVVLCGSFDATTCMRPKETESHQVTKRPRTQGFVPTPVPWMPLRRCHELRMKCGTGLVFLSLETPCAEE